MNINSLPVICLMGPTAVGKSQIAIDLAQLLPCDIISVDSVMVYRGMDIGTAKPSSEILASTPHGLVDIREPTQPYSASNFFEDAQYAIKESLSRERIPVLVGGTMLYFNTLRQGLADLPPYRRNEDYLRLKATLDRTDSQSLYHQLKHYDLPTAKRLHVNDRQRVQRALLVYYLSKKPLSELHRSNQRRLPYSIVWIAIYPESRQNLKSIIHTRFKQMLSQGLIEEASALYHRSDFSKELPAYRAIGYRQTFDYLEGHIDLDTLQTRGTIATCQLVKRQLTWLRSWPNLTIFNMHHTHLLTNIKQYIEACLNT